MVKLQRNVIKNNLCINVLEIKTKAVTMDIFTKIINIINKTKLMTNKMKSVKYMCKGEKHFFTIGILSS